MLLAALLACQDYALTGKPGVDSGVSDSAPVHDTADSRDTGSEAPDDACATFALSPARAWEGAPTCQSFTVQTWDLAIEYDDPHDTEETASYVWSPIAVTLPGYGERVLYQSDGGDVAGVDVSTGAQDFLLEDVQRDVNGLSAAVDQTGTAAWVGIADLVSDEESSLVVARSDAPGDVAISDMFTGYLAPAAYDLARDGFPSFAIDGAVLDRTAQATGYFVTYPDALFPTVADLDGDAVAEVMGSGGIWWPATGQVCEWSGLSGAVEGLDEGDNRKFQVAPVFHDGAVEVVGGDRFSVFLAGPDGIVRWEHHHTSDGGTTSSPMAVGDVTGDGTPELCAIMDHQLQVFDLDGTVRWRANHRFGGAGGCAMADLDANGVYEVIQWGPTGLHLRDGRTGEVLGQREDIETWAAWNPPLVADVDGDGSAEVVVSGEYVDEGMYLQNRLFVVGPASGRWARTRPVWNQWGYDVTSIRDDGTIVSFPFPSWATYNAFRAQPAHDGERPDLVLEATDACATTCDDAGTVRMAVTVSNAGSVEAPAGAVVRAYTWSELLGLREIASATIPEAIGPGMSAAAVELDIPRSDWGDRRVLEVVGSGGEECDWVNNREEIAIPDPCARE